jgi:hypothetical protein
VDRIPCARLGAGSGVSLGYAALPGMRAWMMTPPMTPQAMAKPTLDSRPCDRDHEHDEGEGDGDPRDIEEVAKSIVRRRQLRRLRLLSERDEHQASSAVSNANLRAESRVVNEGVSAPCPEHRCDLAHKMRAGVDN